MTSDRRFVEFIAAQIEKAGEISYRAMFGEYGIYSNGKIFGLICDNKLFIKPTDAGKIFINDVVYAPPYPGAKSYFLIDEKIEDKDWLSELVRLTVKELPEPKSKKKKKK